jgi:hypothetical protein
MAAAPTAAASSTTNKAVAAPIFSLLVRAPPEINRVNASASAALARPWRARRACVRRFALRVRPTAESRSPPATHLTQYPKPSLRLVASPLPDPLVGLCPATEIGRCWFVASTCIASFWLELCRARLNLYRNFRFGPLTRAPYSSPAVDTTNFPPEQAQAESVGFNCPPPGRVVAKPEICPPSTVLVRERRRSQ